MWEIRTRNGIVLPVVNYLSATCTDNHDRIKEQTKITSLMPTPGEAKAKAMPGRFYIHTRNK
jgi:hypothetical protein